MALCFVEKTSASMSYERMARHASHAALTKHLGSIARNTHINMWICNVDTYSPGIKFRAVKNMKSINNFMGFMIKNNKYLKSESIKGRFSVFAVFVEFAPFCRWQINGRICCINESTVNSSMLQKESPCPYRSFCGIINIDYYIIKLD